MSKRICIINLLLPFLQYYILFNHDSQGIADTESLGLTMSPKYDGTALVAVAYIVCQVQNEKMTNHKISNALGMNTGREGM